MLKEISRIKSSSPRILKNTLQPALAAGSFLLDLKGPL